MENPTNPFLFGKPVTGEFFCNRKEELAHLLALFRSRNSGWLYSPRRYGKTSLIREAFFMAEKEDYHTAYVDFLGLQSGQSPARLLLRGVGPLVAEMIGSAERALSLVGSLVKHLVPTLILGDDGSPELSIKPFEPSEEEPELEEALDLPERLAEKTKSRVVLAIDEFQEIAKVPGLEARLRSSMQQHGRVSYLMAGSRASLLRDLFTSPERPFYQFAEHIPIGKIQELELVRYVAGRFAYSGVEISTETAATIVRAANCHPHFAQYFASVAWGLRATGTLEDEHFFEQVVDRVVSALDPGFRMFFDGLAAAQKRVVISIARGGGSEMLSEKRRKKDNLGSASTVASALDRLVDGEVLVRREKQWGFVNPAFRMWAHEPAAGKAD